MFKPRLSYFQGLGCGVSGIAMFSQGFWACIGVSLIFALLNTLGVYLFEKSDRT